MRTLNASDYAVGSFTGGIQEAIDQCLQGDTVLIEGRLSPQATIKVPFRLNIRLQLHMADISFHDLTAAGSVGFQFQGRVEIDAYESTISSTQASPLMFLADSEGSVIRGDLEIFGGNLGNNQGHASGVFVYSVPGWIECHGVYVHDGNGNGFRGGRLRLRSCRVNGTAITPLAHSAEGITAGPGCDIQDCLVENAWTTGILIYCAENYQGVYLRNNQIRNSSIGGAANAALAGNPAIALAANGYCIQDIEISGNSAWDDQVDPVTKLPKPTTTHLLTVKADPAGMIKCGRVFGNRQWGCQQQAQVAYGLNQQTQLIDWEVS